jgi:nitroreductase/dihydropteridine reductase
MSFLNNIEWRRAEKSFSLENTEEMLQQIDKVKYAMIQAPSSFGIQPYHIVCVTDEDLKNRLKNASYNQPQVNQCNTLFVICARNDIPNRVDEYLKETNISEESTIMFYKNALNHKDVNWSSRQAYIALGYGLAACTELKLASCPMEGFEGDKVKSILELPPNLEPYAYLAVGQKSDKDHPYPRFRFSETDMVTNK